MRRAFLAASTGNTDPPQRTDHSITGRRSTINEVRTQLQPSISTTTKIPPLFQLRPSPRSVQTPHNRYSTPEAFAQNPTDKRKTVSVNARLICSLILTVPLQNRAPSTSPIHIPPHYRDHQNLIRNEVKDSTQQGEGVKSHPVPTNSAPPRDDMHLVWVCFLQSSLHAGICNKRNRKVR